MSKTFLIIALTALSVTAISANGAAANDTRVERDSILREYRPAAPAQEFRLIDEGRLVGFGTPSVETEESHIVKTGIFSSIKNGVKKAAKAVGTGVKKAATTVGSAAKKVAKVVATGAKRAGTGVADGVVRAAKAVAKSPVGQAAKKMASDIKKTAVAGYKIVKKFVTKKK